MAASGDTGAEVVTATAMAALRAARSSAAQGNLPSATPAHHDTNGDVGEGDGAVRPLRVVEVGVGHQVVLAAADACVLLEAPWKPDKCQMLGAPPVFHLRLLTRSLRCFCTARLHLRRHARFRSASALLGLHQTRRRRCAGCVLPCVSTRSPTLTGLFITACIAAPPRLHPPQRRRCKGVPAVVAAIGRVSNGQQPAHAGSYAHAAARPGTPHTRHGKPEA